MSLSVTNADFDNSSKVGNSDDGSCAEVLEASSQKKEFPSGDGDSSSSSSSSPEVDQHLHQEKKRAAGTCEPGEAKGRSRPVGRDSRAAKNADKALSDKLADGRGGKKSAKGVFRRAYHKNTLLEIRDKYAICNEYPTALLPPTSSPHPDHKKWLEDLLRPSGGATRSTTPSPPDGEKGRTTDHEGGAGPSKAGGSRDPRERVKQEEQDGIILSPQRRSFGTGCQLSSVGSGLSRPDSPADHRGGRDPSALTSVHHRQEPPLHRRIGSGRIMRRDDLDPPPLLEAPGSGRRGGEAGDLDLPDPPRGRDARDWRNKEPQLTHHHLRYDRDERFDSRRRGFFEWLEMEKSGVDQAPQPPHRQGQPQQQRSFSHGGQEQPQQQQQRNSRGRVVYNNSNYMGGNNYNHNSSHNNHQYHRRHEEEETPEWYSEGPTSQNEYIELVGFDGPATDDSKCAALKNKRESPAAPPSPQHAAASAAVPSKGASVGRSPRESPLEGCRADLPSPRPSSPTSHSQLPQFNVEEAPNDENHAAETIHFNIEDFLENIIGPDGSEVPESSQSKLKQFFKSRESPVLGGSGGGRTSRGSADVDMAQVPIISELNTEGRASPPGRRSVDSSRFFTPINPADATGGARPDPIADILQQASLSSPGGSAILQSMPGAGPLGQSLGGHHGLQPTLHNPPSVQDLLLDGKGHSLEELEAGLRKMAAPRRSCAAPQPPHSQAPASSGQFTDFNEFLSQVRAPAPPHAPPHHHPVAPPAAPSSYFGAMRPSASAVGAEANQSQDDVLAKFLRDGGKDAAAKAPGARQPSLPNALTERDLLTMLGSSGSGDYNSAGGYGSNVGPPTLHVPPQHQQQRFPQNSEMLWKLVQQQKQQQHQQQQQQQQLKQRQLMQQAMQQQQQQSTDPIKQLVGGLQQQQRLGNRSPHPGLGGAAPSVPPPCSTTLRPEVINILQRVMSGQLQEGQLVSQLQSGALAPAQREHVIAALQCLAHTGLRTQLSPSPTPKGGLCLSSGPVSPRVLSPNPTDNMLAPHSMAAQTRLSPLMFSGGGTTGPALLPLPSHQELVARAQCIMQKALLKQELEKSKEKHRKRDSERGRSPNPPLPASSGASTSTPSMPNKESSPNKSVAAKSQSPLAFTPTSVMRKMTADSTRDKASDNKHSDGTSAPTATSGDHQTSTSAATSSSYNPSHPPPSAMSAHHSVSSNQLLGPKSQHLVMNAGGASSLAGMMRNPPPGHPQHVGTGGFPQPHHRPAATTMGNLNIRHHHPALGVMSHAPGYNPHLLRGQQQQQPQHPGMGAPMHRPPVNSVMHPIFNANTNNVNNNNNNIPCSSSHQQMSFKSSGCRQSPVPHGSLNLAQLLGGDVLAQAQAGALPQLPGGKALRLEEIERQHHGSH